MKFIIFLFEGIFIFEKKELKRKYDLVIYFFKNISLIEYIKFFFNRNDYNPIKIQEFKEYIKAVRKKKLFT